MRLRRFSWRAWLSCRSSEVRSASVVPARLQLLSSVILFAGAMVSGGVARAAVSTTTAEEGLDLRLDLSHLSTEDNRTSEHLALTDLRLRLDGGLFDSGSLRVALDARSRLSWNDLEDDETTMTAVNLRWLSENKAWEVALGRIVLPAVGRADVDGFELGRRFSNGLRAAVFGGLLPHPLTRKFDTQFAGGGASLEGNSTTANHAEAVMIETWSGKLDRVYFNQRVVLRLASSLVLSGFGTLDFLGQKPRGDDNPGGPSGKVELTHLALQAQFRPLSWWSSNVSVNHHHTLLPHVWWTSWAAQERYRRGFSVDGPTPVGTRMTAVRWTQQLRLGALVTPYVRLRWDRRHTPQADGASARLGLKLRPVSGYLDASVSWRQHFSGTVQLAALQWGHEAQSWGVQGGGTAMRLTEALDPHIAYEGAASVWMTGANLAEALQALYITLNYQVFVDRGAVLHTGLLQLSWRQ